MSRVLFNFSYKWKWTFVILAVMATIWSKQYSKTAGEPEIIISKRYSKILVDRITHPISQGLGKNFKEVWPKLRS